MKVCADRIWRIAWTFSVVLALCQLLPAAPSRAASSLFRSSETSYSDLTRLKKWMGMLRRYEVEQKEGSPCATRDYNSCKYPEWKKFMERIHVLQPEAQLAAVNRQMNKSRYILDSINWGDGDYWETPGQFLARSGDCEDYAIIKYMTLKRLGWPVDDMRIVIVQDLNLNIAHAILAVYFKDRIMILDNQINGVVDSVRIRHYRPVYSVNEKLWWRHGAK